MTVLYGPKSLGHPGPQETFEIMAAADFNYYVGAVCCTSVTLTPFFFSSTTFSREILFLFVHLIFSRSVASDPGRRAQNPRNTICLYQRSGVPSGGEACYVAIEGGCLDNSSITDRKQ